MTNIQSLSHVVDRFYDGLGRGDIDAVLDCCTLDVIIWHGFDRIAQDRDAAARAWRGFIDVFPERYVTGVQRQVTSNGIVQQFIMVVRTSGGDLRAWPVCVVVKIEAGLISRLDEYIDRAGSFTPEGDLSATCDIAPG